MSKPKSRRIPKLIWFAVAAVLMVVSGCGHSDAPLSDIATSKPDGDLVGTWYSSDLALTPWGLKDVYVHIGKSGDVVPSDGDDNFPNKQSNKVLYKKLMRFVTVANNEKSLGEGFDSRRYTFFTTKIGNMRFANIPLFSEKNRITSHILIKYEVTGNQLIVWFLMGSEAIEKGELKGKDTGFLTFKLTDTTENIVRYLQKGGDKKLFLDDLKIVFQRVKPTDRRD